MVELNKQKLDETKAMNAGDRMGQFTVVCPLTTGEEVVVEFFGSCADADLLVRNIRRAPEGHRISIQGTSVVDHGKIQVINRIERKKKKDLARSEATMF